MIKSLSRGIRSVEVLKVSSRSVPNSVAGAIASVIRENGSVEVQAVGAGAANQAIKSIAIARGYLAPIQISRPKSSDKDGSPIPGQLIGIAIQFEIMNGHVELSIFFDQTFLYHCCNEFYTPTTG